MAPLLAFIRDHSPQRHHCYRQVLFDHISSSSLLSIDHHRYHCLCFNVCLSLMLLPLHCLVVVIPLFQIYELPLRHPLSPNCFPILLLQDFFYKKTKSSEIWTIVKLEPIFHKQVNDLHVHLSSCLEAVLPNHLQQKVGNVHTLRMNCLGSEV